MPVTINGTTGITTPALVNGTALSFRNKIINGNFDIWQRGTSLSSGTALRFLADRFNNNLIGSTYTASQQYQILTHFAMPLMSQSLILSSLGINAKKRRKKNGLLK